MLELDINNNTAGATALNSFRAGRRETLADYNEPDRIADEKTWFGPEGFSFKTLLDTINPLQHIPIVSSIYRELTGDQPAAGSRLAGGALFGGVIGFVASLFDGNVQATTGKDIGGHAIAMLRGDDDAKPPEPTSASAVAKDPVVSTITPAAVASATATPNSSTATTKPIFIPAPAQMVAAPSAPSPASTSDAAGKAERAKDGWQMVNAPMTDDNLIAALTGRAPPEAQAAAQAAARAMVADTRLVPSAPASPKFPAVPALAPTNAAPAAGAPNAAGFPAAKGDMFPRKVAPMSTHFEKSPPLGDAAALRAANYQNAKDPYAQTRSQAMSTASASRPLPVVAPQPVATPVAPISMGTDSSLGKIVDPSPGTAPALFPAQPAQTMLPAYPADMSRGGTASSGRLPPGLAQRATETYRQGQTGSSLTSGQIDVRQ